MAIVLEQAVPFTSDALRLSDEARWETLLPLIRPSLEVVKADDQILLIQQKSKQNAVVVTAVHAPSQISTQLLDNDSVDAILLAGEDRSAFSSSRTSKILREAYPSSSGTVIVQLGAEHKITSTEDGCVIVECKDQVDYDHTLALLRSAKDSVRSSLDAVENLLGRFHARVVSIRSTFVRSQKSSVAVQTGSVLRDLTSSKDILQHSLDALRKDLGSEDAEAVWSVHIADLHGLSRLEIYIAAAEIGRYFEEQKLKFRLSCSSINSNNAEPRGFVLSLCPMPPEYLDAQIAAVPAAPAISKTEERQSTLKTTKISFEDASVRKHILGGCEAVIRAEPLITEYDTIVGDGDCGFTLRDGAKQIMQFIADKNLRNLPSVLDALVQQLEISMGGTSGALYCIFLTALASSLATEASLAGALRVALDELLKYTRARLGDRTMMDALIPFVDTFEQSGDLAQAITAAEKGVEGTKKMEAKLGRSTYLDESATQGVPDPGAYGLLVLLKGMAQGRDHERLR